MVSFKEYKEARATQNTYTVGESARGALETARALKIASELELVVRWEQEIDSWIDFVGDTLPEDTWQRRFDSGTWEVLSVVIEDRDGEVLESLGGIILEVGDDKGRESYENEVLSEAVENFEEVSEREMEDDYCLMLDEAYGETNIAGYTYSTSRALQEVDPVAYRCGFADHISFKITDGDIIEARGTYYRRK